MVGRGRCRTEGVGQVLVGMIGCDSKVVVRGEDDGRWLECEGWGAEIERKVVGCFVLI